MPGRLLAIGDIHGCDVSLATLLERLSPGHEDTVVVLGDVVDRGPSTRGVIEQLKALAGRCRLVTIMGNHEEMMLDALTGRSGMRNWLQFGGDAALLSYGGDVHEIPDDHLEFLDSMQRYWETDTHIFVHAAVHPRTPMSEQDNAWLRWEKTRGDEPSHFSGKRVICGHTPQTTFQPRMTAGWTYLDTWTYHREGWLSLLDVAHDLVYQANQRGEFRLQRLTIETRLD